MNSSRRDNELDLERQTLEKIRAVHLAYLAQNKATAERLAAHAAEAVDEGIRDIVDEDAEADAAVRAVLVREMSEQAMHAARRVTDLESQGDALAFGKTIDDAGDSLYVGRRTVLDGDDALLVDWRARASIPFYRATPIEPMGVVQRRHLHYDDPHPETPSNLTDYSDEVFRLDAMVGDISQLRGEAALMATLSAPTGSQMHSVVATIQAEQDAVVRASSRRPLVVQGGPGTGKTVVALHRAAYLLYDQRAELADTGVLIVGPSRQFLNYISGVLPSLGESGVVSVTVPRLYRGIRLGRPEPQAIADLKGQAEMIPVVAAAVAMRQRQPTEPLVTWYGSRRVVVSVERLQDLYARAQRHRYHNDGASEFRSLLIDSLSADVYDRAFHNLDDARSSFGENLDVRQFLIRHYPELTPEQALNDLLGSPALLKHALRSAGVPPEWAEMLARPRQSERELEKFAWSDADAALLDEMLARLGPILPASARGDTERTFRDEDNEFVLADSDDSQFEDLDVLLAQDEDLDLELELELDPDSDPYINLDAPSTPRLSYEALAEEEARSDGKDTAAEPERDLMADGRPAPESDGTPAEALQLDAVDALDEAGATVLELAAQQQSWQFGHVVVDEAQDLTPMQWRMVARRTEGGAVTIVGDLAQRAVGPARSWDELIPKMLSHFDLQELTVNYRSPSELDRVAGSLLSELAPDLRQAQSIRSSGHVLKVFEVDDVRSEVLSVVAQSGSLVKKGRVACIGMNPIEGLPDDVVMCSPRQAKGLEFDVVVLVEPIDFLDQPGGLGMLYVGVTRATQLLSIVHSKPLPGSIANALG